jgi:predicted membrane protein
VSSAASGPSLNGDRALREVLELAAVTTLLKGGTVYALPAGAMPGGGSAAAVFRYQARVSQVGSIEPERK